MSETRTEKYKKYRESLNEIKANNKSSDAIKMRDYNVVTDKLNTTSTLPLDEVLGQIEDEEKETVSSKMMTKKKIQIIIMVAAGVILTAVLVVIGIIVFRG